LLSDDATETLWKDPSVEAIAQPRYGICESPLQVWVRDSPIFMTYEATMSTEVGETAKRRGSDASLVEGPIDGITTIARDDVERRAYERFLERGRSDGADVDDWLEAERELLASRSVAS
jgi:hypothetical protein